VFRLLDLDPSRIFLIHFLDQPPHVEKLVQFVNAGVNRVDLVLDPALAVLRVFVPFWIRSIARSRLRTTA